MHTFQKSIFYSIIFLLCTACTSSRTNPLPFVTASLPPSYTPRPTSIRTPTPELQLSPTPNPHRATAAAQLTQVALGKETATARAVMQTANAPSPTPTATIPTSELLEMLEAVREPEDVWTATSPDGQWVATVINQICAEIGPEGYIYKQIKFSRTDSSTEWVMIEELSHCGVGYGYYAPIGWSPNSRYFYYASVAVPDGCGFVEGGDPVLQVDVINQRESAVATAIDWTISPDQKVLALTSGNELILWDMELGETARITINTTPGNAELVVWRPDGSALMVTTAETVHCELPLSSSIVRIDLPGLEQTPLIVADARLFFAAEWLDTGMVVLRTYNYGNQLAWLLDPQTGELAPTE